MKLNIKILKKSDTQDGLCYNLNSFLLCEKINEDIHSTVDIVSGTGTNDLNR